MFRTTRCSSSGRLVHAVVWYCFMHPYLQFGWWQDVYQTSNTFSHSFFIYRRQIKWNGDKDPNILHLALQTKKCDMSASGLCPTGHLTRSIEWYKSWVEPSVGEDDVKHVSLGSLPNGSSDKKHRMIQELGRAQCGRGWCQTEMSLTPHSRNQNGEGGWVGGGCRPLQSE